MTELVDSGIEWLGDIPSHWKILPLFSMFQEHKLKNTGLQEKNLLSLSYGKIIRKNINTNEGLLPMSFETYNIIEKGFIVFRLTDLQNDKHSLRTGLCKERGIITSAYVTLKLKTEDSPEYMHYLFHSYDVCKVFYNMGDGVRQGMNYRDLKKIPVLLPPPDEQKKIADFLDKKCSAIDSALDAAKKLVEKFREYKKSLITETVTKGLNPYVEMQEIKFKYLMSLKSGDSVVNSELDDYSEYPVYGGGKIIGMFRHYNVLENEIIIGRVGANCGNVTILEKNSWATDNALIVETSINRKYLYYLLESADLNKLNTSNAQPLITAGKVLNLKVNYFVNEMEQKKIADFLDEKCSAIDENISKREKIIEKLMEYKKSLIYEAVTGKLEV